MPHFRRRLFVLAAIALSITTPRIALAEQQTPQQKEEERKKKAQEQQRHNQQQQQRQSQDQQKQQEQRQTQDKEKYKHLFQAQDQQKQQQQEQQKLLQQRQQQEQQKLQQQRQAQEQLKLQQQRQTQDQQKLQQQHQLQEQQKLLQQRQAQEQLKLQQQRQTQDQQKLQQQHQLQEQQKLQLQRQQDEARRHKLDQEQHARQDAERRLREEQLRASQQRQAAAQQQLALQRKLNAEEQRAKAEREAHRLEREKLIQRQRIAAANERSAELVNARLRLENERLRLLREQRKETVDRSGQRVIAEPGNRTIYRSSNHVFIHHNESENFRFYRGNVQNRRASNGNVISTIMRPDGSRVEIEVDSYGRPLRRVRISPDGRRYVLFRNRAIAIGAGFALGAFLVTLPPPRYSLPPEQYIVDADNASEDDIYGALQAPPVEALDRGYSLDEVLASVSLRERMRSVSVSSINFEFGSWELAPDQAAMLESVAAVIKDIASQNPGEVFLIEGHTDAVGSDEDNLSLSDRRAQTVAQVLSEQFQVPAENLVTQGYGKQFLLVPSDGPERRNRRVVVRRVTPLLGDTNRVSAAGGGDGGAPGGPDDGPPDGPDGPQDGPGPNRQ
jgi:outer membrane protein OmpA-like peptidoglycan-associated protein